MHERVHNAPAESRRDIRQEFGVSLRSLRLGLIGKSDVIEFHRQDDGSWRPFPVEYKRGKSKTNNSDKVQLCAQAICLEETLSAEIPGGAIYYGKERRRTDVAFDPALRAETEKAAERLHALIRSGVTPKAVYKSECESCSLLSYCLPKFMEHPKKVGDYLNEVIKE